MAKQTRDPASLARASFKAIETPDSEDLDRLVHPQYRNWEANGADTELRGPKAFAVSVANLNRSFSELHFEVIELIVQDERVAARTVMHGVHSGPMRSLPATGRPFHQSQSHWYRVAEGRLVEHVANRDDLGFLHQVGAAVGARVGSAGSRA